MTADPLTWDNLKMPVEVNPVRYGKNEYPFDPPPPTPPAAPAPAAAAVVAAGPPPVRVSPGGIVFTQVAERQVDGRTVLDFVGEMHLTVVLDQVAPTAFIGAIALDADIRSKVTRVFLVEDDKPDNRRLRCVCQLDDWQGDPALEVTLRVVDAAGVEYASDPQTVETRASHTSTYDIFVDTGAAVGLGDLVDVHVTATLKKS